MIILHFHLQPQFKNELFHIPHIIKLSVNCFRVNLTKDSELFFVFFNFFLFLFVCLFVCFLSIWNGKLNAFLNPPFLFSIIKGS